MQSKGWIWQVCLLLTSALVFSICLSSPAAFGQTETEPQEQVEPKSGDTEQDGEDAPDEDSKEEKPSDDAPESESKDKPDSDEPKDSSDAADERQR